MRTQVDLMLNGKSVGEVANFLANQGRLDIGKMKPFIDEKSGIACVSIYIGGDKKKKESYKVIPITNATLRRDEWKQLDEAVVLPARYRLSGIQDLIDNGLVFNLGNAMGTTVLEWHDVSDPMEADMTMDGLHRGQGDRPKYQHNYLPIPIIHVDYEINARELAASRNMGNPIDTTAAESAGRRVAEKLESLLFTNTSYSWGDKDSRGRNTIYSYLNHPDRNLVSLGTPWDQLVNNIGTTILGQVMSLKLASINDYHYGPWHLYIPPAYELVIDKDYDTVTPGTTIRERIMKIDGIKKIKVIDTLPANNVLLVEMNPQTVRLVRGLGIQNVQWGEEGNFVTKFKVMTIQVPQIRSDQNRRSGIQHLA